MQYTRCETLCGILGEWNGDGHLVTHMLRTKSMGPSRPPKGLAINDTSGAGHPLTEPVRRPAPPPSPNSPCKGDQSEGGGPGLWVCGEGEGVLKSPEVDGCHTYAVRYSLWPRLTCYGPAARPITARWRGLLPGGPTDPDAQGLRCLHPHAPLCLLKPVSPPPHPPSPHSSPPQPPPARTRPDPYARIPETLQRPHSPAAVEAPQEDTQ